MKRTDLTCINAKLLLSHSKSTKSLDCFHIWTLQLNLSMLIRVSTGCQTDLQMTYQMSFNVDNISNIKFILTYQNCMLRACELCFQTESRGGSIGLSEYYDYIMSFIIMYCNHIILVTQIPVCIGCILISYCNQLYS